MKNVLILTLIVTLFLSGCSVNNKKVNSIEKVEAISLTALISNPEKYHKKRVKIEGYFYIEHDGNAIYINKSDFENLLYKNGIYLYINPEFLISQGIEKPYKGYVSIRGVFNKNNLGSHALFSGAIEVTSIYRLYKRGGEDGELNMD